MKKARKYVIASVLSLVLSGVLGISAIFSYTVMANPESEQPAQGGSIGNSDRTKGDFWRGIWRGNK